MQTDNRFLDDLARLAASAVGAVVGVREEVEAQFRQQLERVLSRLDVVSREEFEAVREMASTARREQEAMAARLAALEAAQAPAKPARAPRRPRTAAKPAVAAEAPKPRTRRRKAAAAG